MAVQLDNLVRKFQSKMGGGVAAIQARQAAEQRAKATTPAAIKAVDSTTPPYTQRTYTATDALKQRGDVRPTWLATQPPAAQSTTPPGGGVLKEGEQMRVTAKPAATATPTAATPPPAVKTEEGEKEREARSYDELLDALDKMGRKSLTPEDEKKMKRDKLIGGIGDALTSIANLYYTTQGAPDMYNPKHNLSAAANARWELIKADNAKRDKERLAYMYKQYELLKGKRQEEQKKEQDAAKLALLAERYKDKLQLQRDKLDNDKDYRDAQLSLKDKGLDQQHELGKARIGETARHNRAAEGAAATRNNIAQQRASTARYNAEIRATKSSGNGGSGSGSGEYVASDEQGNARYFRTKGAADDYARQHGTYIERSSSTSQTKQGRNTKTDKTQSGGYRKSPEQQREQVEHQAKAKQAAKPTQQQAKKTAQPAKSAPKQQQQQQQQQQQKKPAQQQAQTAKPAQKPAAKATNKPTAAPKKKEEKGKAGKKGTAVSAL